MKTFAGCSGFFIRKWEALPFLLVKLGALVLALGCRRYREPRGLDPPESGPVSCKDQSLVIRDIQADFRDIWAGRETIETGKRTSDEPDIEISFSQEVVLSQLVASLNGKVTGSANRLFDCAEYRRPSAREPIHRVALKPERASDGLSTTVRFVPTERLHAGCEYRLEIRALPATENGSCLSSGDIVAFRVATDRKTPFERETERSGYNQSPNFVSFDVKTGINTLVDDAFARYRVALGLRPGLDTLHRKSFLLDDPYVPGQKKAYYEVYYRNVPVDGGGYWIHERNGCLRSINGFPRVVLDTSLDGLLSKQDAVERATAFIRITEPNWEPVDKNISTELRLMNHSGVKEPALFVPAWRVSVVAQKSAWVDVDGRSGSILFAQPRKVHVRRPFE